MSLGIHVRLVRDYDDAAIHAAEDMGDMPSDTIAFQTYFYGDETDAVGDYHEMARKLKDRYEEASPV